MKSYVYLKCIAFFPSNKAFHCYHGLPSWCVHMTILSVLSKATCRVVYYNSNTAICIFFLYSKLALNLYKYLFFNFCCILIYCLCPIVNCDVCSMSYFDFFSKEVMQYVLIYWCVWVCCWRESVISCGHSLVSSLSLCFLIFFSKKRWKNNIWKR